MSFSPAPAIASAVVLASAVFMFMLDIDPNDVLSFSVAKISELTRFLGGQELLTNVFREVTMVLKNLSYLQLLSITTVILLFMYLLPRYLEFRRCYALIEKMPGPPVHPVPFVGHAKVILDIDKRNSEYGSYALVYQMMMGIYELYGSEKLLRMWLGCRPFIMLFDPESVESILSSPSLTDKAQEYSFLKPWLGEGLVTSQRGKWKNRRKILTPAFHFKILHDFLPVMNEQAHILVKKVEGLWRDGKTTPYPNLLELITLCTLDVICETAMGTSVHAQTSDQSVYVKSLHQVSQLMIYRLTRPWFWPDFIFYATSHGRRFSQCLKNMHDFAADVVKERKQYWIEQNGHLLKGRDQSSNAEFNSETVKAGKKRLVFLDLLLHEHLVNQTLNEEDMREEVETFMFAGHDTTAMAISWTLYLLGLHHDIQDKVRAEVDAIFDEEEAALKNNSNENNNDNDQENDNNNQSNEDSSLTHVTEEMLKKMKYLDCVMKEVQRVYPTAPFIGREITEDTQICGYTVPKGTGAGVLTFLLHRNPRVFPSPERFDPERFRPENCIGRHPYAYVPFSAGVRNCIGQKFALSEQKIVVSSLVRRFVVTSVDQRDKLIVVGEMVLRPKNDLRVIFEPRTDRLFGRREEFKQTSATLHQQNPSERSPSPSPSQSRVL